MRHLDLSRMSACPALASSGASCIHSFAARLLSAIVRAGFSVLAFPDDAEVPLACSVVGRQLTVNKTEKQVAASSRLQRLDFIAVFNITVVWPKRCEPATQFSARRESLTISKITPHSGQEHHESCPRPLSDYAGGLNRWTQHSARTHLALKTKAKIALALLTS